MIRHINDQFDSYFRLLIPGQYTDYLLDEADSIFREAYK